MSNQTAEQPQYVYFVTNEDGSANVEANSIQPQIVFTTEGFSSVVEDIDYENPENADSNADIWSKCNNALRDLLVFLVKKHHIEGLYLKNYIFLYRFQFFDYILIYIFRCYGFKNESITMGKVDC